MTTHIMVDLETWGTAPGCDIRSIGAVVFDPVAGTLGDEFYSVTSEGDSCGLTHDPDTVKWWSGQSAEAQQALEGYYPIGLALHDFANFIHRAMPQPCEHPILRPADICLWAHGPHFDEAILAACYRAVGIPVPWSYRAPRDCRTIFDAAGIAGCVEFEGVEHDALADAKNQALRVIEAFRRLRAPVEALNRIADLGTCGNGKTPQHKLFQQALDISTGAL